MRKIPIAASFIILISISISPLVYAEQAALECTNTWIQSEASKSCGENFCTYKNMHFFSKWAWFDIYPNKVFVSRYDANKNECTFETLCVTTPDKKPNMEYERRKIGDIPTTTDQGLSFSQPIFVDEPIQGKLDNKEVATCTYTSKTVKMGTRLKNQNGKLETDGAS